VAFKTTHLPCRETTNVLVIYGKFPVLLT